MNGSARISVTSRNAVAAVASLGLLPSFAAVNVLRLRAIIKYRDMAVRATIFGGDFVRRQRGAA